MDAKGDLVSVRVISIRQPWAALILAGKKRIELRTWKQSLRGPVLLHAGKIPVKNPNAWALITPEIEPLTQLRGGIIGAMNIVGIRQYTHLDEFLADQKYHGCGSGDWNPKGYHGYLLQDAMQIPFESLPGQLFFFRVNREREKLPWPDCW